MEYIISLLRINLSLTLFWVVYKLFLAKLTFPSFNRAYFLGAIICSLVLPNLRFNNPILEQTISPSFHQGVRPFSIPASIHQNSNINWLLIVGVNYLAIVVIFLGKILMQHVSLWKIISKSQKEKWKGITLCFLEENIKPFSFWGTMFLSKNETEAQLQIIIAHESIHCRRLHSFDVLLVNMVKAICWFNPFVWMMAKEIKQNQEYEVDHILLNLGINSKSYQYQLLHSLTAEKELSITNHFNAYNLKKRIIMMNKKPSSKTNLLRYAFVLPAILASVSYVQIAQADKINTNIKATLAHLNAAPPTIVPNQQFNQSFMKPQPISVKPKTNFKPKSFKDSKERFEKPVSFTVKIPNSQNIDSVTKLNYDLQYKKDAMVLLVNGKTAGPTDKVEKSKIVSSNLLTEAEIAQSCPQFKGRQVLNVVTQ